MSEIRVFVTYDVDQDDANTTAERTHLTWRGIDLLPDINNELVKRGICHTFFVRFDDQIKDVYGSYTALYEQHRPLWQDLADQGNELAWHPHLYVEQEGEYRPLRDPTACCQSLIEAWSSIHACGLPIKSVRLGEAWHSNLTMKCLDDLGLAVDSTAVPARQRKDTVREFDWLLTSNEPYHPSTSDYRVPGVTSRLRILEVPMTTWPIQTDYDQKPLRRYLNPTFRPELFRQWLDGFLSQALDHTRHLVLVFHPDELLPRPANGLHSFGWEGFVQNIDYLVDKLGSMNHRFCKLGDTVP